MGRWAKLCFLCERKKGVGKYSLKFKVRPLYFKPYFNELICYVVQTCGFWHDNSTNEIHFTYKVPLKIIKSTFFLFQNFKNKCSYVDGWAPDLGWHNYGEPGSHEILDLAANHCILLCNTLILSHLLSKIQHFWTKRWHFFHRSDLVIFLSHPALIINPDSCNKTWAIDQPSWVKNKTV